MNQKTFSLTLLFSLALMTMDSASGQTQPDSNKTKAVDVGVGHVAWFDITSTNLSASKEFYGKLFGWTFKSMKETDLAVEIEVEGKRIGTMRVAEGKISPFNGVVYVQVDDVEASCKKAKELGATVPEGFPFDLPEGRGAIGLATDPVGHPIGLYSKTQLRPAGSPAK